MRRQVTTIIVAAGLTLGPAAIATAEPYSPDARDANTVAQQVTTRSVADPRSPDARDAQNVVVVPAGVIAKSTPVDVGNGGSNGFPWAIVGIAGGGLALALLLGSGTTAARRRGQLRMPFAH